MDISRSTLCTILVAFSCSQFPARGRDGHRGPHQSPAVLPMSAPFKLATAVRLSEWPQIRRLTERIQTDAGALVLLCEMPQIEARYGNESFFLELARKWRHRIPILPEHPGPADDDGSSWIVLQNGAARTISITFYDEAPEDSITILAITWVGKEITNLSVTSGFDHVFGRRHGHREHTGLPRHLPGHHS